MSDEKREIQWASPERSLTGTWSQQQQKRRVINKILGGIPMQEIVEQENLTPWTIGAWRRNDENFDAACDAAIEEVRKMLLPSVESNIWQEARKETPSGARIGIRLMEEFGGWGKNSEPTKAQAEQNDEVLADWYDDPVIFDAEWKDVEDDD